MRLKEVARGGLALSAMEFLLLALSMKIKAGVDRDQV
jgi:hypothetical protein